MPAPLPKDEAERLRCLLAYRIVDTEGEPLFDDVAGIALALFDVPIALITFIDEERQWFKARRGLDAPETARTIAFCAFTILGDGVMVVPDATKDERFADNPLVTGPPNIRFYAGAPLKSPEGYNLGSVAIIDDKPRDLDQRGRRVLMELAGHVVHLLDVRRRAGGEATRQLTALVENSRDYIGLARRDGIVTFLNVAGRKLIGLDENADITRYSVAEFAFEAERERLYEEILPAIIQRGRWRGEMRLRHLKTGEPIDVELDGFTVTDPVSSELTSMAAVARPLAERRELEERLRHAVKMEALGRLAGGVAHDFNNLLTVIGGCAGMIRAGLPAGSPLGSEADEILSAIGRASALTGQLLAFSRREITKPRAVRVGELVRQSTSLLQRLVGKECELELSIDEDEGAVRIVPGALHQVLVNLVVNARDAIGDRGRIEIRVRSSADRRFVVLTVIDDGVGISPETQARMFEPYFTTKEIGKGTGLGLSTVHGIVEEAQGRITVDSKPGKGTTISISLPVTEELDQEPAAAQQQAARSSAATLLVVDDEDSVRRVLCRTLERAGYTVLSARSGPEALELASTHSGSIC